MHFSDREILGSYTVDGSAPYRTRFCIAASMPWRIPIDRFPISRSPAFTSMPLECKYIHNIYINYRQHASVYVQNQNCTLYSVHSYGRACNVGTSFNLISVCFVRLHALPGRQIRFVCMCVAMTAIVRPGNIRRFWSPASLFSGKVRWDRVGFRQLVLIKVYAMMSVRHLHSLFGANQGWTSNEDQYDKPAANTRCFVMFFSVIQNVLGHSYPLNTCISTMFRSFRTHLPRTMIRYYVRRKFVFYEIWLCIECHWLRLLCGIQNWYLPPTPHKQAESKKQNNFGRNYYFCNWVAYRDTACTQLNQNERFIVLVGPCIVITVTLP